LSGRRYLLVTLGCFKNEVESDLLRSHLGTLGMRETGNIANADIILVMSCGFIEEACDEGLDTILELHDAACRAPAKPPLIVAGCMGQRYGTALLEEMNELAAVLGCDWKEDVGPALAAALRGRRYLKGPGTPGSPGVLRTVDSSENATIYVKAAEGCDRHCGYCTIPAIKGAYRSRPVEEIAREVRSLAHGRPREVVLLAQDLSSYGTDLEGGVDLAGLVRRLSRLEEVHWLRLLYLQPEGVTTGLLREVASNPRVCRYFDIPFQHASAPVLRAMGRQGSSSRNLELVERIRREVPGAVIRSTVMVGYPGETDEDFSALLEFLAEARFEWLGAFVFSPEEGTPAARMPHWVPADLALSRYNTVVETQENIEAAGLHRMTGCELEVVVDELCDVEPYDLVGRSYREAPVVDGMIYLTRAGSGTADAKPGDFVRARVTGHEGLDLVAEI